MDHIEVKNKLTDIHANIEKKQLKNAIDGVKQLAQAHQNWAVSDKISELETNYRYMIHYFIEGNKDPEQQKIYDQLVRDLYTIADNAAENILLQSSSSLFYDKMRSLNVRTPVSIDEYKDIIVKQVDTFSFIGLLDESEEKESRRKQNAQSHENTVQDLFYVAFTLPRANNDQFASLKKFMQEETIPVNDKNMLISAVTMNILQRFDSRKVEFLLDVCSRPEPELATRAIIGVIPIFQKYASRWHLHPECTNRLKLLSDDLAFNRRFVTAVIQYIQAHETEKITKKLTEEIIPEMMKLSPMIGKKINLDEWMGETGFEDKNPEWEKILDDAGLTDKMQEFSELQLEGADVFHSTFSNLKQYPFFNEMSNWFLAFDPQHPQISQYFPNKTDGASLLQTMIESALMCNSDKYSFCFSIMMMPEQYRNMMISQLNAEGAEIKKMQEEELVLQPHQKEENISKQYIQDLYRFFKLYRRKADFTDIFELPLNYHELEAFHSVVLIPKNIERIALYYFEKNYFPEALSAYKMLAETARPSGEVWQKIGYSHQMLGDIESALAAYQHADLMDDGNTWVLKRIAQCYRVLKQPEKALEYYRRVEQLHPDDLNIQLNIGHCYLELKNYDEALNYYFKVDLLDSGNTRAWRSIAWSAFLSRKFDVARKYYTQILEKKPNAHDFLNAGHVEICLGNLKKGVEFYQKSLSKTNSFNAFRAMLNEDEDELQEAGVNTDILPVILDKMRYDGEEK